MDKDRHRSRKIRSDHHGLSRPQHWDELSCSAIKIATGVLDGIPVLLVGKPVHEEGAKLAEDIMGDVPRSLGRKDAGQTVLSTFLGNQTKGVELGAAVLVADRLPEKLVGLVEKYNEGLLAKLSGPRQTEKISADDVEQDLAGIVLEAHLSEGHDRHIALRIIDEPLKFVDEGASLGLKKATEFR